MAQDIIQFFWLQTAILLGVIASFVLPYVRKKITGEISQLDPTYIYHLVITALWQFIISFAVYSAWQPPVDIGSSILIMVLAFFFGYGGSDIQKEAEKNLKDLFKRYNKPTASTNMSDEGTTDLHEKTTPTSAIVDSELVPPELVPEAAAAIEEPGAIEVVEEITRESE